MNSESITQLVRAIQSVLHSRSAPSEEELVDLASQHEELVDAVQLRLEKVERLLHQGLRSEAIELAEVDPNLNDLLTALDFPELGPWNELLEANGIQPVAPIPVEAAAELNDAYLATGSIEKLLQHYRTISLARAPLSKRIAALRKLAEKDSQSPVWSQDLKEFERHRMKEIKQELDLASRAENLSAVADIDDELSGAAWTIEVPAAIRQQARAAHTAFRRKSALAELETLSHQLSDAYADFDRDTARRVQQRFLAVQGIAGVSGNHPLLDIAGPALDWLEEESKKEFEEADFKTAIEEIELAFDRKTSVEELEKLYHRATRHGKTLPPMLESRLADRRDQLLSHQKRKQMLMISGTVAGLGVVIVAMVFLVQTMSFNKSVAGHNEQLGLLLEAAKSSGELTPVSNYFQQMDSENPAFASAPVLLGRKQEFELLTSAEQGRSSQLQQLLISVQKVIAGSPSIRDFGPAFSTLEQMKKISKGEQERAKFLQTEQQLVDKKGEVQKVVDAEFSQSLTEVSETIQALPGDSVTGYDAAAAELQLLAERNDVSQPLKQSVTALQSKVQQDRQMVASNLQMAAGLRKITDSVGQLNAFEQHVVQYARDNPGTERSAQFESVVQTESVVWKSVGTWHLLRRRLKLVDLTKVSPTEASLLVSDSETLQRNSGPFAEELLKSDLIAALRAIASRSPDGRTNPMDAVKAVFARRTISKSYMLETRDGQRYYTALPPSDNNGSTYSVEYFTTTTGTQTSKDTIAANNVLNKKDRDEDWLSPQTRMYRRIEERLKTNAATDYDTTLVGVIKEIIISEDSDALMRLLLIDELMKLGSAGSEGFRRKSEPLLSEISARGVSRLTNWTVPGDKQANEERNDARGYLKANGERVWKELEMAVGVTKAIQQTAIPPDLQWVGWMHRNSKSEWIVSLKPDMSVTASHSKLCILQIAAEAKTKVTMAEVGSLKPDSKISVPADAVADSALEGRPVYLLLEDSSG